LKNFNGKNNIVFIKYEGYDNLEKVDRMREKRNAQRILVEKPLGIPRKRWEDDINTDQRETGCVKWDMNGTVSKLCPIVGFVLVVLCLL
jgi:hypothetical protein